MTPTVSVLFKSYNHAAYVAQAMNSVLEQSLGDFEFLITDDCSIDDSANIIRSFKDDRIKFEQSHQNRGISTTTNGLVARASGQFIAILNSDDLAMPNRFAKQVEFLSEHPQIAAVFSVPQIIGEHSEPLKSDVFKVPFDHSQATRHEWLRYFFFHQNCLCAPSVMIRRQAFQEIGNDDPRLTNLQDLDRWVRLLERHEIAVVPDSLTAFRQRANNANASALRSDSLLRSAFEKFQILKRYRHFAPPLLQQIFAQDLAQHSIDANRPTDVWLAEVALTGSEPWHLLFALDILHESAATDSDYARLRELTGTINAFSIPLAAQLNSDQQFGVDAHRRRDLAAQHFDFCRQSLKNGALSAGILHLVSATAFDARFVAGSLLFWLKTNSK